ncbi:hypothetical protein EJB05_36199, partial [Eragrostis curvula]
MDLEGPRVAARLPSINDVSVSDLEPPCHIENSCCTVAEAFGPKRWQDDVSKATSVVIFLDLSRLLARLRDFQTQPKVEDRFKWRWTADGQYSAKSAYLMLPREHIPPRGATAMGHLGTS